ncbi:DUF2637 domain-containing protein [Rhodococcus hoagii]|uniref:DUF2637 domain-containing protein n=1 Tax=Rhodococcus hoagii TaxID=43767 RepID=A0A9Q4ZIK1_RHOHA|nr:DUF2637 domain-containing protein [Prescottella equi]NKT77217.1 DUF2637 domain-containing protein [Prescottella equi]NKZ81001.1 DUF2637 domain-containing protein [Prescottella equi]
MALKGFKVTGLRVAGAASVGVAILAFTLSFTALSELGAQNGIPSGLAWMFPLIVDGLVVVSTVASALLVKKAAGYAWFLLVLGTMFSVAGNVAHAFTNGYGLLGGVIASVPPLVYLAVSHLTILIARATKNAPAPAVEVVEESVEDYAPEEAVEFVEAKALTVVEKAVETVTSAPANLARSVEENWLLFDRGAVAAG